MESKKINQLATNVNPQTSDLTTIGDPVTGQLKKITWLQVAHLIGAQASLTLQDVTNQGATTTLPITTGGLTLSNLDNGVLKVAGGVVSTYPYGQANGVASLDSGGKVPASQLPSSIMDYKGTWNAATNTPTLVNGTGDTGDVYRCNVAGTVNFGAGNITFKVGDWAIYNGTIWEQSNNSDAVSSVFGRTGDITAQEGDYNIGQLGDVTITSAATNDYLRYNGSSWVNTQFPTFVSSDKLVLQVRNNSGATINKGTVVYINGATAGYPTIAKAQADADNTSAQTLGLVQDNISNNSNGVVVIVGQITGIDTSAYPAGTQLYLSGTTAGAFTSTKTLAPTHLVYVGIVTTQNAVNGIIEVKIQNGYELDEIHDVAISSVANNQGLFYESSTSLWKNKSIATVLGYTPEQPLTFSAPLSRSTNTVSIPAATGSVNGYLTSTDWTTFNNKMTNPMTTLGDIIFGGTSGNANRLAGNITTTKQYLSQTGTGTESASPTWATITGSDITGAALTKSDDTNVTLTLGGTPATALLRAASLTLGWTGQLSVARGGTGLSALGTEGQLLRVNTGATALEYFTPTYISAAITSLNGLTVATQTFATGTTGTDFGISSASGVHTFNIPIASATKTGKLSSTDWSTFNGKQDALTNPITGDGTETAGNVAYFTGNTSIAGGSSLFFDTAKGLGINVSGTVNSSLDVGITNTTALLIGNSSDTIASGDVIGNLSFFSRDGSTNSKGTIASIRSYATTTYNTGSVSGDLRFYVSDSAQPNGAIISGSEALRINPDRSIRMLSYTTNGFVKFSNSDGTLSVDSTSYQPLLTNPVTGTGTQYQIPYFSSTGSSITGSSNIVTNADGGLRFGAANSATANYFYLNKKDGVDGGILIQRDNTTNDWQITNLSTTGDLQFYSYGTSDYALKIIKATGAINARSATLTGALSGTSATFSSSVTANGTMQLADDGTYGSTYKMLALTGNTNGSHRIFAGVNNTDHLYIAAGTGRGIAFWTDGSSALKAFISTTGAATFSSSVNANSGLTGTRTGIFTQDATGYGVGMGYVSGSYGYISSQSASSPLALSIDGNPALYITTGRNVGIGNTSPSNILSISASTNSGSGSTYPLTSISNTLATQGDGSTTFNFAGLLVQSGNGAVQFYHSTSYAAGTWEPQALLNVATNHPLIIRTNNTERIRINSGGDVQFKGGAVRADGGYFALRTSTPASIGYFIPKNLWLGSGTDISPSIAAESGYGINFYTGGTVNERLSISSGGNMTFNGSNAQVYFYINQGTSLDGGILWSRAGNLRWQNNIQSGDHMAWYSYSTAANVLTLNYTTAAATFAASVTAAGGFFDTSDVRVKTIIERNPILDINVDLVKYTKKGDSSIRYGYIAQEVQNINRDVVGGNEILTLNYQDIHSIKIAALEREIKELKSKLN